MFGLGKHGPDGKYAVILDVGSASAGAAIVVSDAVTDENPIIYSHREWAVIKDASTENPTRFIEEAILRLFLVLGNEGIKVLRQYDSRAKITDVHAAISAPWAHTITQQAEYEDDEPFTISNKIIESLVETAKTESIESSETSDFLKKEGLEVITNQTLHITANGYTVKDPRNLEAKKIYISHSSGLAASKIVATIKENQEKIFPDTNLTLNTFMLSFYDNIRDLFPNMTEACLVDITGEATEIAVIRNTEMVKVSHALIGIQTLTRMLEEKLKMPVATVKTLMMSGGLELDDKQKMLVDSVFEEYIEEISNLFTSLGDILTVPKNIYLHTDRQTEPFFVPHIMKAARRSTGGSHTVIPITKQLFDQKNVADTAIMLSSFLFHKLHKHGTLAK